MTQNNELASCFFLCLSMFQITVLGCFFHPSILTTGWMDGWKFGSVQELMWIPSIFWNRQVPAERSTSDPLVSVSAPKDPKSRVQP